MTDREFLRRQYGAINGQLQTAPSAEGDLVMNWPELLPTDAPRGQWSGWVNPLPVYDGREPVVTGNEFDAEHSGRDMAYLNTEGLSPNPPEVYGGINDDRYYVPSNAIPVVAPGAATIWYSKLTAQGWTVRLDHHDWAGLLLNTYLTHMSELFVPLHPAGGGGPYVYAGQPLGYVGAGPTNANHLHFEMWSFDSSPREALDPALYLPHWGKAVISA
jgi:murein DD-endopeptidase MepM/ murein hydrolase activator NlpD